MSDFQLPMELPRTDVALKDMYSANPMARYAAAMSLAIADNSFKDKAVSALVVLAGDPLEQIRSQAVEGFAQWRLQNYDLFSDTEGLTKSLIDKLVKDESPQVRSAVIGNAGLFFDNPVPVILGAVADVSPGVRACAADQLDGCDDIAAIDALKKLLNDNDDEVRLRAAIALGKNADSTALKMLVDLLLNPGIYFLFVTEAVRTLALCSEDATREAVYKKATGLWGSLDIKAMCSAALLKYTPSDSQPVLKMLESRRRKIRVAVLQALYELPDSSIAYNVSKIVKNASSDIECSLALQVLKSIKMSDCTTGLKYLESVKDTLTGDLLEEWKEIYNS